MGKNKKAKQFVIPDNFQKIIVDFIGDLTNTFPEYSHLWKSLESLEEQSGIIDLYKYFLTIYPERFFDILYKNVDIFKPDSEINTHFLPNVDFKLLYNCENISEMTRDSLWKYLQLILLTVVNGSNDKSLFKDTSDIFKGIDENELDRKIQEVFSNVGGLFEQEQTENNNKNNNEPEEKQNSSSNNPLPNPENLMDKLKVLLEGKIGQLAQSIAEDVKGDFAELFGDDISANPMQMIQKLVKNQSKAKELIKKVFQSVKTKMQDGSITKEDFIAEQGNIMEQLKEFGGMDKLEEMFNNGGIPGMGKNAKLDENKLRQMEKQMQQRERIKAHVIKKELEKIAREQVENIKCSMAAPLKTVDDVMNDIKEETPLIKTTNKKKKAKK